jgi:hypothetical protein
MEHINVAVRIRPDNEAHAWAIEEPNHIYLASDRHPKKYVAIDKSSGPARQPSFLTSVSYKMLPTRTCT